MAFWMTVALAVAGNSHTLRSRRGGVGGSIGGSLLTVSGATIFSAYRTHRPAAFTGFATV